MASRSKSLTLGNIQGALLTWLSVERKFSYLKYNTCKFTLLPATLFFQVSWILLYELIWIFFLLQCTYHDDDDDFTI